jgi:hypothetical protein
MKLPNLSRSPELFAVAFGLVLTSAAFSAQKNEPMIKAVEGGKAEELISLEEAKGTATGGPRPPKPILRELATGYLLQYSFMSPKPYSWNDVNTVMLSGWEVDKSGGHFEYQPDCIYPTGFGFHSDWFKLVDTSSDGAITLKHKVARQTEGTVTLEFRFKLPTAMEGACWQLRDLEQAGVSLVTKDGNLCWETGKVLMPCETNRDYGVKVIADIDSRKPLTCSWMAN